MSKEKKCCCKKCKTSIIIGGALFALAFIYLWIACAAGAIPFSNSYPWGIAPGTGWFWSSFSADPGFTGTGKIRWWNMEWYKLVSVSFCYLFVVLFIVGAVLAIIKKKYLLIARMFATGFVAFWTSYIFVSIMVPLTKNELRRADRQ